MICMINAALYTLLLLATSARYEYEVLWYWYSSRSWALGIQLFDVARAPALKDIVVGYIRYTTKG